MSINLITDPWLPARRLSGARSVVRPSDITSNFDHDPILALDFPRPDWNAAVTEMLIGLLACVMAPEEDAAWADLWASPPSPEALHAKLAPLAFAFDLGGDGPRCFQDFEKLPNGDATPVSALLIDAPSEESTSNKDLFIKRGKTPALCMEYAAAALITMQTFAPEGGRGHLVSMRGGGPLTTLIVPRRRLRDGVTTTLWDVAWGNTPSLQWAGSLLNSLDAETWPLVFPWLAKTRSAQRGVTIPDGSAAHKLQSFFAMPRRIHLDFASSQGANCALDGPKHDFVVRTYRRRPHGVKYQGWEHPLSPHQDDAAAGRLSLHPQEDSGTYRDWLAWIDNSSRRLSLVAACVASWPSRLFWLRRKRAPLPGEKSSQPWQSGLLAYGFNMKQMNALGWLEARIPYFDPPRDPKDWSGNFLATAKQLVARADAAAKALRYRAQLAAFGQLNPDNGMYTLPKTSPGREAFQDLFETFWRETEPDFLNALKTLRNDGVDTEAMQRVREVFLTALRFKALLLFDATAGTDNLADQNARRIVDARARLSFAFGETGDVRGAPDIISAEARKKSAKRSAKKKEAIA